MSVNTFSNLIDITGNFSSNVNISEVYEFMNCKNIKNIIIFSNIADINVYSTTKNKMLISVRGKNKSKNDFIFQINRLRGNVHISFSTDGAIKDSNFKLDIYLPSIDLDKIKIESSKGNIEVVSPNINYKQIDISSPLGYIKCNCNSKDVKTYTIKKETFIDIDINNNSNINTFSTKGNITLILSNVTNLKLPEITYSRITYYRFIKQTNKSHSVVGSVRANQSKVIIY